MTLPDAWSEQRDELHRIAAHLLARARYQASGRFSLEPAPGGFATPTFATGDASYRRLRVAAADRALLVDEHIDSTGAVSNYFLVDDISLASLADGIGVELDPDFSVGNDSPALGDLHRPIRIDPLAVGTVGDWYALGAIAIDRAVAGLDPGAAGVARLWPEHFDLGTDVEVAPGRRCNLGASAGDEWHPEPYLYVGPWGDERPGDDGYWNAPFGAARGYADVVDSDAPSAAATAFFDEGIRRLRG